MPVRAASAIKTTPILTVSTDPAAIRSTVHRLLRPDGMAWVRIRVGAGNSTVLRGSRLQRDPGLGLGQHPAAHGGRSRHLRRRHPDPDRDLKQIEALWSAKDGTPAAERLEVLSLRVERYEQEHFPIPDPILSTARLTFCTT